MGSGTSPAAFASLPRHIYLKNSWRLLSVKVMPWLDTLKCTSVGFGNGFREYNNDIALRTASGPVNDSVSHVNRYKTLHAAPWVINCCWAGEWNSIFCKSWSGISKRHGNANGVIECWYTRADSDVNTGSFEHPFNRTPRVVGSTKKWRTNSSPAGPFDWTPGGG